MIVVSEAAKVDTHGDAGVGDRFVHDFRGGHHGDGPAPTASSSGSSRKYGRVGDSQNWVQKPEKYSKCAGLCWQGGSEREGR